MPASGSLLCPSHTRSHSHALGARAGGGIIKQRPPWEPADLQPCAGQQAWRRASAWRPSAPSSRSGQATAGTEGKELFTTELPPGLLESGTEECRAVHSRCGVRAHRAPARHGAPASPGSSRLTHSENATLGFQNIPETGTSTHRHGRDGPAAGTALGGRSAGVTQGTGDPSARLTSPEAASSPCWGQEGRTSPRGVWQRRPRSRPLSVLCSARVQPGRQRPQVWRARRPAVGLPGRPGALGPPRWPGENTRVRHSLTPPWELPDLPSGSVAPALPGDP